MNPKQVRLTAGLSIERAAVAAGVTSPTLRLYEASQEAVREDKRRQLAAYYQRLAARLPADTDPGPVAA
jgi:transcriptional regulator with XRE-family HTH domain